MDFHMDERELDEVTASIIELCRGRLEREGEVHGESSLTRDLGLDSIQALELISDVESSFNVTIPSELLPEVDTVRDVARLILRVKYGGS